MLPLPAIYGNNHTKIYYNIAESLPATLDCNIANDELEKTFAVGNIHMIMMDKNMDSKQKQQMLNDIDKVEGVKELLLLNGTCEADYVYKIYTIGNGSARYIDEVNGSCVMFYEDENGGTEKYIISVQARMGCERVSKIWLKDGKVSTEEISYKEEVGIDEDYYSNPYPLDYADVTDKSLLK